MSKQKHDISSPMKGGVTSGITTCSCGAEWKTFYSKNGLEWQPLNDQCAVHDREANLPNAERDRTD